MGMNKADEMLENLGYKKYIYPKETLKPYESYCYEKDNVYIEFNGYRNSVYIGLIEEVEEADIELSMQELYAIVEKCKELGWI